MTTYTQLVKGDHNKKDGLGWCLRYAQSVFNAPVRFNSAREAWNGQLGRHPGEEPPLGIEVPIWLDHYGVYGSPARFDNWGHVAVRLADGRVLTSPLRKSQTHWPWGTGNAIYASIAAMQRDLGGSPTYLGWSEYMNGKRIVRPVAADNPNTSKEKKMAVKPFPQDTTVRTINPSGRLWMREMKGRAKVNLNAGTGSDAAKGFTTHVYANGLNEGDILEFRLEVVTGLRTSNHYLDRVIADRHGLVCATRHFALNVPPASKVHFSVYSSRSNGKGKVTLMGCEATYNA